MPGQHHLDHEIGSNNGGRHLQLQRPAIYGLHSRIPQQRLRSSDFSSPDPSQGGHRKRKAVHWDPRVIDNEKKISSRHPQARPATKLEDKTTDAKENRHSQAAARNTSIRRESFPDPKALAMVQKAPPAVPDAPKGRPPPAPRPARLLTPDLPEIEESMFFVPKEKIVDYSRWRSDPKVKSIHLRTENQLDVAMKYIQERKARGW